MQLFKLTFLRNVQRPRLPLYINYLEVVTFIKADDLKHATKIAIDISKEHGFVDHVVEAYSTDDFLQDVQSFLLEEGIDDDG